MCEIIKIFIKKNYEGGIVLLNIISFYEVVIIKQYGISEGTDGYMNVLVFF